MGYRLGVDLGTTFTAAAFIGDAGPRMVELGSRNLTVPSVVFVADTGTLLFGEAAERRSSSEPERVLREFKRRIGDTVPMVAGDRAFAAVTLQTELLRWVLQITATQLGGPPDHVVLTHPASWGFFKTQLMRDIAAGAGIPYASLCPEPVAAAIEYAAKEHVPVGVKIAIYDLGGGTFDVAILEKTDDGFEIVGTPLGVDHLGGTDFDEAVLADAVSKLGPHGLDLDAPATSQALVALRRECIEAKEDLSSDVTTDITSLLGGAARTVRLTRGEFEGLIRPGVEETIRTTVRALRLAGVDKADLHAIVLVGGSSRIPLVTELLNAELGVRVAADTFPKHDIARGAVRYGLLDRPAPAPAPAPTDTRPGGSSPAPAPAVGAASFVAASTPAAVKMTATEFDPRRSTDRPAVSAGSDSIGPDEPSPRGGTRGRPTILIGLIVAVVVVALAVGVAVIVNRLRSTAAQPGAVVGSASTALDQEALSLPVARPLPETQLIAPRYDKSGAPAELWRVDTADPAASTTLDADQDGSARAVGMSTDRRTITYLDSGANAIRVMPATGGTGRRLFPSPDGCGTLLHASWSPTDLSVFVIECKLATKPAHFVVMDIDGGTARDLDTGSLQPADPTISPDGTTIAFSATDPHAAVEGGSSIFVMPIDGSAPPTQVTDGAVDIDPAWSPEGELAFGRSVGDPKRDDSDILVVSPAAGAPRKVTSGPAADGRATWSPDGRTIAFVSDRDSDGSKTDRQDLWLVPAAGGKPTRLGLSTHSYATPTWWHR